MYLIEPLDSTEYATLSWLSDHGYDAGILDAVVSCERDDGLIGLSGIPESVAWGIRDAIDADPHAWLACCGSRSLAEKLNTFVESIV